MIETCLKCGKQIGRGEAKETGSGYICCDPCTEDNMLDAKCLNCGRTLGYGEERKWGNGYVCDAPCVSQNMHAALGEWKPEGKPELPFRVVSSADVTLIARTHYDDLAVDKWCKARGMIFTTDAIADGDALSEFAGRACYLSFNKDRRRAAPEGEQNTTYLNHIREVGHTSITEHPSWTFLIDDFSKNCSQELVRHRVGVAYSIQSSRYVDQFSNEYFGDSGHSLGVYIPPEIQEDGELYDEWIAIWKQVVVAYNRAFLKLRGKGHDKKDARSLARHIIPGSMCNAIVFTVNARELNHIFKMRASPHADPEIRKMTMRLWDHVKTENLFSQWEEVTDPKYGRYLIPKNDTSGVLAGIYDKDPKGFEEWMRKNGFGPRPRTRPSLDSLVSQMTDENHQLVGLNTHEEDTNEDVYGNGSDRRGLDSPG